MNKDVKSLGAVDPAAPKEIHSIRAIVTLQDEAALRLMLWADAKHLHKNVAMREVALEGMKSLGLLPRNFEYNHKI